MSRRNTILNPIFTLSKGDNVWFFVHTLRKPQLMSEMCWSLGVGCSTQRSARLMPQVCSLVPILKIISYCLLAVGFLFFPKSISAPGVILPPGFS